MTETYFSPVVCCDFLPTTIPRPIKLSMRRKVVWLNAQCENAASKSGSGTAIAVLCPKLAGQSKRTNFGGLCESRWKLRVHAKRLPLDAKTESFRYMIETFGANGDTGSECFNKSITL